MSYGQNMPWGLQATKHLNGMPWNGQIAPYYIQSGYASSIFRGDPVIMTASGAIQSLWDWAAAGAGGGGGNVGYGTHAILGVFAGCSYVQPTSVNPIDPASPGRSYWPGGTQTLNGVPAIAFVIDDPDVIYNMQSNGTPGMGAAQIGSNYSVAFTQPPPVPPLPTPQAGGNTQTGVSTVVLDQGSVSILAQLNVRAIRWVETPGNVPVPPVASILPAGIAAGTAPNYNNVEVLISNHAYRSMPLPFA